MTTASGIADGRNFQKLVSSSQHNTKQFSFDSNGFSSIIQKSPPPLPPAFFRKMDFKETGVGKVKVILRISNSACAGSAADIIDRCNNFLTLDKRKKQITLTDPSTCDGVTPENRRLGVAAPKMFTFDSIFNQDDSQAEICSGALTDVINAVIKGTDCCLFSFGQMGLGKSYTMLGTSENTHTIGIIPCAISWLFKGISEQKERTGTRFSVRVSAVEIGGPTNQLKDLLIGYLNESEQSPGIYLQDDHLFHSQPPHCELRVSTAEKAAHYLDTALEYRSFFREEVADSHFLFTLHIYQYNVAAKGGGQLAGGRSRLHLIDIANTEQTKATGDIPLSSVGNLILAILNGQKHLPYKDHKLTQLLKECLGSVTCHATMIAHVSPLSQNYLDTLTTIQLASRIRWVRRRKMKFVSSTSNSNSSGGSSGEDVSRTGTSSEPDPSSSDLSADTVIYVGRAEEATDGEHPPVYIPSLNSPLSINKVLKSSSSLNENKVTQTATKSRTGDKAGGAAAAAGAARSSKTVQNHRLSTHSGSSRSSPSRKETSKIKHSLNGRTSDEQWIDGPRISKSKIAEAFQLMKEKYRGRKRETWIDGPMKEESQASYGYMDNHKKYMIKKWVEYQTVQIQKAKPVPIPKVSEIIVSHKDFSKEPPSHSKFIADENLQNKKQKVLEEKCTKAKATLTDEENEDEEEPELPPALPLIQPLSSREVSIESLDQMLRERMLSSTEFHQHEENCGYRDHGDEQLELIEVEEPLEPIPMQDKCLQVTEEDINLCMGKSDSSLLEVDQQSTLENVLRALSEDNLSISSLTDSTSVFHDLERILPHYLHSYSNDYEDILNPMGQEDSSIVHKSYCSKLANLSNMESLKGSDIMKNYKSMILTDIFFGEEKHRKDDSSIYSEPIYLQDRFCENCKANMYRPVSNDYTNTDFFTKFQRYNHQQELYELRHPDGASNPNLEEGFEKKSGGEACAVDLNPFSEFRNSQPLPPPQIDPALLNFETGIAAIKLKHKSNLQEFDYYSTPRLSRFGRGANAVAGTAADTRKSESRCDISGPESEPSPISHTRSGKCKHNHNKSFCSWFLNPFTCKYVDEPREAHL